MAKGAYVGIPSSYTPVEYIESSGTQYIDTGVTITNDLSVECEWMATGSTNALNGAYNWQQSLGNRCFTFGLFNGYLYVGVGSSTSATVSGSVNTKYKTIGTPSKMATYQNDVEVASQTGTLETYSDLKFLLFACGETNNSAHYYTIQRTYYCKIYKNNVLIRNFIPVVDQDNVACLYDLVDGKFYYNQGTRTFTAGSTTGSQVSIGDKARNITEMYVGVPASYTPVEYIESTGTQTIDTGYYPSSSTKVRLDYQLTGSTTSYNPTNILKASNGSNVASFNCGCAGGGGTASNARFCFGSTYSYYVDFTGLNNSNRHTVEVDCVESKVIVDNSSTYNVTKTTFTCTETLKVPASTGVAKIYSCKVYDNGTLVRDFIPVVDNFNTACLYEQVERKFYYNQGSGTFTAGTAGTPVSIGGRARKIVKGYVGVNGVARLCFQWKNKTPPNTFMLCHFNNNCYDEITEATIPTGFGVTYITGKFSQAIHRNNTDQTQFTNWKLPKLEDVFAGTADPFTITYWSNGSGDFWYKNLSPVYVSSRETSYLGIKVSAITNPSVGVTLCYYYTGSNSYARETTIRSGVTSADYGGTFHHHAIEVMQTGIRFYFDGVLKCTVTHVDYKYNSNNIRYVHFQDIDELMICDGNIYGGTSFLPPQEPYVT